MDKSDTSMHSANEFEQCLSLQVDNKQPTTKQHEKTCSRQQQDDTHQNPQQSHHNSAKLPNGYSSDHRSDNNCTPSNKTESASKSASNTAATAAAADTQEQISGIAEQQEDHPTCIPPDEQLSPNSLSLRRSSRVSALNAKKKLQQHSGAAGKEKESNATEHQQESQLPSEKSEVENNQTEMVQENADSEVVLASGPMPHDEEQHQQQASVLKRKLKRKLDNGQTLDQYDCKFGIRLDDHGDVVMMSDESEISSLNEEDVTDLKAKYEQTQQQEVDEEVLMQREMQIHELETALRVEEAKLLMMKKLKQSQQQAEKKQQESIRRLAPGVVQNSSGQAYKPKVAVVNPQTGPHQAKVNGIAHNTSGNKKGASKANVDPSGGFQGLAGAAGAGGSIQLSTLPPQHMQVIQQLYERLSQNPQQMAGLIKTLPPQTGQALTELLRQYAIAQTTGANQQTSKGTAQTANSISQPMSQAQIDTANKQARELTQQNITKSRQQLRRELDQLITKLPVPKAPATDLQFIPNGNQPEFAYLLGLDLTVQRVLKDKQMFRKADFPPYRCEECDSDFTPAWKAICGENEDYHLYCERCVRQAQKRKVCQDYKTLLGRAFQQIKERENEFEKQVAAGKFNVEPVMPTATPTHTANVPSGSEKLGKILPQQNNGPNATLSQTAALKGSAAAAAAIQQQLNQQQNANSSALNLSKSATTTGPTAAINAAIKNAASTATAHHQQKPTPTTARRTTANTNSTAAVTANAASAPASAFAALFQQNPLLQQQLAMAAMQNSPIFRQISQLASNPMMVAALTQNPMLLQQLFTALAAQQQQRTQQTTASTSTTSSNTAANNISANAAATLAQFAAAQKSAQSHQQQQPQQGHRTSSSTHHHQNAASTASATSTTTSSSTSASQQQAQLAAMMMNPATNPLILQQLQQQNPQLLNQLNAHPQFAQMMRAYMQQMKAGNAAAGGGGRGSDRR